MPVSTHDEYLTSLRQQLAPRLEHPAVRARLDTYAYELLTVTELSLDPQRDALHALYCPTGQGQPYDPVCMLRSWLLLTLNHETSSPQVWAARLTREPLLAILAGFEPGHTPCATAHRDFIGRYADGPYAVRKKQAKTLSQTLAGRHERRLHDTTEARQAEAERDGVTQSEALCRRLLAEAEMPRDPQALPTRLDDLLVNLGLRPSLEAGLFGDDPQHLVVEGDGTPLETASSPRGTRTCACPPGSHDCDHPRLYTNGTSQWGYHPHRGFVFGDESYTISTHINGHDLPLMTIMGTGNESDFTLSPRALDELLKVIRDHDLPLGLDIFVGDGHHDTLAIYRYCQVKGMRTVIPLKDASTAKGTATSDASQPQLDRHPELTFDTDGTPLCPGGCRLRHAAYSKTKNAHYYACPHKRKQRDTSYRFYPEQCPRGSDCRPDKRMGYGLYVPSQTNLRYFPEIPRGSTRFTALYEDRSGVERSHHVEDGYHLDRCTRQPLYGLIRLTLVNVAKHARLRWLERTATRTARQLFQEVMARLLSEPTPLKLPN